MTEDDEASNNIPSTKARSRGAAIRSRQMLCGSRRGGGIRGKHASAAALLADRADLHHRHH